LLHVVDELNLVKVRRRFVQCVFDRSPERLFRRMATLLVVCESQPQNLIGDPCYFEGAGV
jgi:hypothetical protein